MRRRLSMQDIENLRADAADCSRKELAALYGLGRTTVIRYLKGHAPTSPRGRRYGQDVKDFVRAARRGGATYVQIHKMLGVDIDTARRWCA